MNVLNEASNLVTACEAIFKRKLEKLKLQFSNVRSTYEKDMILQQTQLLYEDYKKSLQAIESFAFDNFATERR